MDIILYILIFSVLDIIFSFITRKTIRFSGLDMLFFASWFAGINYGISKGIVVSLSLVVIHGFLHPTKIQYILFSLPAQISAVVLGNLLGIGKFTLSLAAYQVINTTLMLITGGFGVHFIIFLIINTMFNVILHKILLGFV